MDNVALNRPSHRQPDLARRREARVGHLLTPLKPEVSAGTPRDPCDDGAVTCTTLGVAATSGWGRRLRYLREAPGPLRRSTVATPGRRQRREPLDVMCSTLFSAGRNTELPPAVAR